MATKKLTKYQEFQFEMLYKERFKKYHDCFKDNVDKIKLMARSKNVFREFDSFEEYIEFLSLYNDIISWRDTLRANLNSFDSIEQLNLVVSEFSDYFGVACWNAISTRITNFGVFGVRYIQDDDFVRKYKDKLNWNTLSTYYNFSLSFFNEMLDYIDVEKFMERNTRNLKIRRSIYRFVKQNAKGALK